MARDRVREETGNENVVNCEEDENDDMIHDI